MTTDRSSLHALEMEPFERLQQLPELAPPPEVDARVLSRFAQARSERSAPVGRIEGAINALVVGSYAIYALGQLTRILFG
jgi:hypothetical protein